jgi:hypothetical protein
LLPGFAAHNAWAVVRELALLAPVLAAAVALRTQPPRRGAPAADQNWNR